MLKATHTRQCPWTLVDFNEQRRGRLNLIRHLLDVVPDYSVPDQPLALDPLEVEVSEEKFRGPVKPIKGAY